MSMFQIVGLILLGILGLIALLSYISMVKEWNHVKIGDEGTYINDSDGWHTTSFDIKVIKKNDDFMVIKFGDNTEETINKYDFVNQYKTFKWYKDGKIN